MGCEGYSVWKIQVLDGSDSVVILIRDPIVLVSSFVLSFLIRLFSISLHIVQEGVILVLVFKHLTVVFPSLLFSTISVFSTVPLFPLVLATILDSLLAFGLTGLVVGVVCIITFRLVLVVIVLVVLLILRLGGFTWLLTPLFTRRLLTLIGFFGGAGSHTQLKIKYPALTTNPVQIVPNMTLFSQGKNYFHSLPFLFSRKDQKTSYEMHKIYFILLLYLSSYYDSLDQ